MRALVLAFAVTPLLVLPALAQMGGPAVGGIAASENIRGTTQGTSNEANAASKEQPRGKDAKPAPQQGAGSGAKPAGDGSAANGNDKK